MKRCSPCSIAQRRSFSECMISSGVSMFAAYVEGTGIGPYEGARVRIDPSGNVFCATGLTSQGQGHYTSFAQIVASELGCDPSVVTVVTGDTTKFNWGAGTYASRALVTAGNAVQVASAKVRAKVVKLAAELLEVIQSDVELVDGSARVIGAPERTLTSSGSAGSPNALPTCASTCFSAASTWGRTASGSRRSFS